MAFAIESLSKRFKTALNWADARVTLAHSGARAQSDRFTDRMSIMGEVRMIGAALIFILLMVFVLTEIFGAIEMDTDADGNYEGPFGGVVDDLEGIGATAMGLLVIALLVIAASAIMRFFGSSGFGSR